MKQLLLFIGSFFAVTFSFAQNFEIGLNGGMGYNTAPSVSDINPPFNGDRSASPASFAGSVKVAYNYKKWKFGIEADYLTLSYKFEGLEYFLVDSQLMKQYGGPKLTAILGKPSIPLKFFADRRIVFKHFEVYGGISAGYVLLKDGFIPPAEFSQIMISPEDGSGISIGLQIGGTYFVTKRVGINADVQGNYMSLNHAEDRLFEFPATIGVCYRFL